MSSSAPVGRGRAQIILLATLFFAPFIAAWVLYFYFPEQRPGGTVNYGELIHPVRAVPEWSWLDAEGNPVSSREALAGKWTLVHRLGSECDAVCIERLVLTRQTHIALHKDRTRVQRIVLAPDSSAVAALKQRLQADEPELRFFSEGGNDVAAEELFGTADRNAIFLVDPLGNYLMMYPAGADKFEDFRGLQKDLKKLLKLSNIG